MSKLSNKFLVSISYKVYEVKCQLNGKTYAFLYIHNAISQGVKYILRCYLSIKFLCVNVTITNYEDLCVYNVYVKNKNIGLHCQENHLCSVFKYILFCKGSWHKKKNKRFNTHHHFCLMTYGMICMVFFDRTVFKKSYYSW